MADTVQVFKALGDETRLRILNLLRQGELCVCDIMKVLGIPQSKASRHLAQLRATGLVTDRREGRWMHYTLATAGGALQRCLLACLLEAGKELPRTASDLRALERLRLRGELCAQRPPSNLARARRRTRST